MIDFGAALDLLKAGWRVARTGWNGKGMWLVLVHPINGARFKLPGGPDAPGQALTPPEQWDRNREAYSVRFPLPFTPSGEGEPRIVGVASWAEHRLLPWIGLKTADDCFVPWLASQTDMLAEDWTVVP